MRNLLSGLLFLSLSISIRAAGVFGDKPIHIMTVGGQSFTNVVIQQETATHLFFQHDGGVSSVRLADLDPQLQKQLGYDSVKGAELLNDQAMAQASYEAGSSTQSALVGTNDSTAAQKGVKPAYGTITKEFRLGKTEKLELTFPNRWLYDCAPSVDPASPGLVLRFGPQYGTNFVVMLSTLSSSNSLARAGSSCVINRVAHDCGAKAVDQPVVQRIGGAETSGHYFSCEEQESARKERNGIPYRFQMQGMVTIDDFCLYFTTLHNYPDSGEDRETLEMIRSAHFSREEDKH